MNVFAALKYKPRRTSFLRVKMTWQTFKRPQLNRYNTIIYQYGSASLGSLTTGWI
jgi:hypothetical protein